jgi:hypothetical protein
MELGYLGLLKSKLIKNSRGGYMKKETIPFAVLVPPSKKLTPPLYIAATDSILEKLKAHPLLAVEVPSPYPTLSDLADVNGRHKEFHLAAINGDRVYKFKRDVVREESQDKYSSIAHYLTTLAGGDPNRLQDTGMGLRYRGARSNKATVASLVPYNVTLRHGLQSTELVLGCGRPSGVGGVEVQMCTDPSSEANWSPSSSSKNCTHLVFTGLQPGQKYYFRIRYILATGTGPWCEPVSLISM